MNTANPIVKLLAIVGFFIIAGFVVSLVVGLLGGLLHLAFKLLIPLAIAVLIVRFLSNRRTARRNY